MSERSVARIRNTAAIALCVLMFVVASMAEERNEPMSGHATGTFEVKMVQGALAGGALDPALELRSGDKAFHGDLEASSKIVMLSAGNPASGMGAYVALEKVTGVLGGRSGSFVLMHQGTMNAGAITLDVAVVPGSGTDALEGLTGRMTIRIDKGQHCYDFAYGLGEKAQ